MASSLFLLLAASSLFLAQSSAGSAAATSIGVNYVTSDFTAGRVAMFVKSLKISAVRLHEPNPDVIRSFGSTNVSLLLIIPNHQISDIGANPSSAATWINRHIVPYYPRTRISAISVGNDVLYKSSDHHNSVLPAIKNIHSSLRDAGIESIDVSTTVTFMSLMTDYFPSSAQFKRPVGNMLIRPLLEFLERTNSSFMMNMYPCNFLHMHPEIRPEFARFEKNASPVDDIKYGVRYFNLFDMMVAAVKAAMAASGHHTIPIIVTETGWPSSGSPEATLRFAEMYVTGLMTHLNSGMGTPVAEAYIYELFDRDDEGQKWGMFYQNMTQKYDSLGLGLGLGGKKWRGWPPAGWVILVLVASCVLILFPSLLFLKLKLN